MQEQRRSSARAYTLPELCLTLFIGVAAMAFLWPRFPDGPRSPKALQMTCLSHTRQIALAMLGYAEDYDEHLPPVAVPVTLPEGATAFRNWGPETVNGEVRIPGLIQPYVRYRGPDPLFHCPLVLESGLPLDYMYNDLAAGAKRHEIAGPSHTVLVIESDAATLNFGHARSAGRPIAVMAGRNLITAGGAVSDPVLIRHSGGCNAALADGHARWFRDAPNTLFFPPGDSDNPAHTPPQTTRPIGPDPAGDMVFQGRTYLATFHIR